MWFFSLARWILARLFWMVFGFILLTGTLAYGFRYRLIKKSAEILISDATEFRVKIGNLHYQWPAVFTLQDVALYNPAGFEGELFAKSPAFYIDIDPAALFREKIFRIRLWRVMITELHIEKNKRGVVNGKLLKKIKRLVTGAPGPREPGAGGDGPSLQLDRLVVEIKKVDYIDRTGLTVKQFKKLHLPLSVYENITDFGKLVDTITDEIMKKAGFTKYFQLGQYYFSRSVDGAAKVFQTVPAKLAKTDKPEKAEAESTDVPGAD